MTNAAAALVLIVGGFFSLAPILANAQGAGTPTVAVGFQCDSTHVYVAPEDLDRFVASRRDAQLLL